MSYFASASEVDRLIGGLLRLAVEDPIIGPQLAAAGLTFRLSCHDPEAEITICLLNPVTVVGGACDVTPDVELICRADLIDQYLRGEYSLIDGLASGEVIARGRVSRVLKLLPALEPMFPRYRRLVMAKDLMAGRHAETH